MTLFKYMHNKAKQQQDAIAEVDEEVEVSNSSKTLEVEKSGEKSNKEEQMSDMLDAQPTRNIEEIKK